MTYSLYTSFGPFTDGSSPGVSAEFINPLEAFLAKLWADSLITSDHAGGLSAVSLIVSAFLEISSTGTVLSGSTAGTATLWQPVQGGASNFKLVFIALNGFRNGGGSAQTMVLPSAFSTNCAYIATDIPGSQLLKSASAETVHDIVTLATGGGTEGTSTTLQNDVIGACPGGFDTFSFNSGEAVTHNGVFVAWGV